MLYYDLGQKMTNNTNNFIFRLPQTLIRALGIKEFTNFQFSQVNIIRNKTHVFNSDHLEKAYFQISEDIVKSLNPKSYIKKINLFDDTLILPDEATIDYNILTSSDIFYNIKKIKNIKVVPYESFVHNPAAIDLINILSFFKTLKRSYLFWSIHRPLYFYDWIDMITLNNFNYFLPWFWKPINLDIELYKFRLCIIAEQLSIKYEFMNKYLASKNPILIQLTEWPQKKKIVDNLEYIYNKSNTFRNLINTKDAQIFLKPHRSVPKYVEFTAKKFRGVEIIKPETLEESLIPSEILINSSNGNSPLFNFQAQKFIGIMDSDYSKEFSRLTLSFKRLSRSKLKRYFI
jgi:hypothetical protein